MKAAFKKISTLVLIAEIFRGCMGPNHCLTGVASR